MSESGDLQIDVGPHWIISTSPNGGIPMKRETLSGESSAWFAPWLERFGNGSLQLGFSVDPDNYGRAPINRSMLLYSENEGDSWWFDTALAHGVIIPFEASDGMRHLYGGTCSQDYKYPARRGDSFTIPRYLSYDRGRTWEGPETVELYLPQADLAAFNGRPILELADGRYVTPLYLSFRGEEKSRVIVVASSDKGRRWEYLSTVGYDPDPVTPNCSEPVLLQLASGNLLCTMRREGFAPMSQAVSADLGQTWSDLEPLPGNGVWPDLCQLESGIVACAYGRPGCHIMFNADGNGNNWSHQTPIIETLVTPTVLRTYWGFMDESRRADETGNDLFESVFRHYCGDPGDAASLAEQDRNQEGTWSKGYASVREIRPGELLYVYGVCRHPQDWRGGALPTREELLSEEVPTLNSIMGTIIKVQRLH